MIDRIVKLYRKMSRNTRRILVFLLAAVIAFSTLHILTFPATAVSRKNGEDIPGIVTEENTSGEDGNFDDAPEETIEVTNPENTETPSEENYAPEETDGSEEPVVTETPAVEPETEITPEETEAPEEIIAEEEAESEGYSAENTDEDDEEPEEESDPEADVETAADWEEMFRDIERTGIWADDLLEYAESQIGYRESKKNFVIDGEDEKRGYTRYGAWYGDPYAKWDSLFILFNMYYTGITQADFPYKADCEAWVEALEEKELFFDKDVFIPSKGDLVFADTDEDGESDHAALVKAVEYKNGRPDKLIVIEGDAGNEVKQSKYEFYNPLITGFAKLPENPELAEEELPVYTLTGSANRIDVTVEYEEGALPEGTTMEVKTVGDRNVINAINETVSEENREVVRVQAVDIIFRNSNGAEIEPSKPVKVTMKSKSVPQDVTDKPIVVHVDEQEGPKVIETGTPQDEPEDTKEAVTFEAGSFSVYAIVYTIETYYTSFDGSTYRITVGYTADALIPEGAELNVREILPETEEYLLYLQNSAAHLGVNGENVSYSRFFDISIVKDGYIIEPAAPVTVTIELDEMPDTPEELSVVHFKNGSIEQIENVQTDETSLQFETDSFSVYGVIVNNSTPDNGNLDGCEATLNITGTYIAGENVPYVSNPTMLVKTSDEAEASVWLFEATSNPGEYYISTVVNGEKKYMNIAPNDPGQSTNSAGLSVSSERQALKVTQNNGKYMIGASFNGQTYYVNLWEGEGGAGIACWNNPTDYYSQVNLTFTQADAEKQYAVIIEYNNKYYSLHPDGTLQEVTSAYDPVTNRITVDLEYPLVWNYQSNGNGAYNLCVPTVASGFYDNNLPSGYYYRYLDPGLDKGWQEESAGNPNLKTTCAIQDVNQQVITSGGNYIGVSEEGGLHIVGLQPQENAAKVYLADLAVPPANSETHDTHMVNHIDIAIAGDSSIKVPLAYGDYYDAEGNKIYTSTKEDHILEMQPVIDITTDNMKQATITASAIVDGEYKELDNVFYITGYSQNHETGAELAQVRIEGSFKVSNIPNAENADNDPAVRQARKDNPIIYSVSVPKTIPVEVKYNGVQLYDAEGEKLVFNVPVNLTASFNYWDEGNNCPPLHIGFDENADFMQDWKDGKIVGNGYDMSGMDFKLGTSSESELSVPALEINKIIQKEDGTYLKTKLPQDLMVSVYRSDKSPDEVIGVGVDGPVSPTDLSSLTGTSRLMHDKKVTAGTDGFGSTYDYDVPVGMIHIKEDEKSISKYIEGADGLIYQYVGTRMETEYAWRTDGDENKVHNADGTVAVPEVLGSYSYEGAPLENGFLEFYIYNIYKPIEPVDVPIDKSWDEEINTDSSYDWTATFVLEEMEVHESGPESPDANTTIWRAVEGLNPLTIHKGDSEAVRTFEGLPKYRYYETEEGVSVYRILYSVDETAYELKHNGTIISKWDNVNGLTVGDKIYGPTWPHDAGDDDDETGIGPDDPRFYHVIVENHIKDETVIETLKDLVIKKQWEDGAFEQAGVEEKNAYATFQLKRYKTVEHVSYDPDYYDGTDATVTLIGQDGNTDTLTVKKGASVNIVATFSENGAVRYTIDGTDKGINLSSYSGDSTQTSEKITVTGNMTIRKNNYSWQNGSVSEDHLVLAAGSGSETAEDTEFTNEEHFYTLNREKGWIQTIDNLPLYTESQIYNGEQNLYHYSYYFVEVDTNPDGFYAEFTDGDGNPVGDATHRVTEDNTTVNAYNRKIPELFVRKEWHDIEDPDNYPEIRFTLFQGVVADQSGRLQQGQVFVGANGESYVDIPLNSDNNWTWKCPGYLPQVNEAGQPVGYYAVELTGNDNNQRQVRLFENSELNPDGSIKVPGAEITTSQITKDEVWLWSYYNDHNNNTAYRNDQQMPKGWEGGLDTNTGTLTIVNRSPKYMQMDIKKKIMEYQEDGSLATTTGWASRTKDIVLKIQLMRRIYIADAPVDAEPLVNWQEYGIPFYVGYDSEGHDIVQNDNDFDCGVGLSAWHWTILDQNQENGLPAYGYYTDENGERIKVHYRYIPFEVGAYKNLQEEPLSEEFDWFVGLQPNAWDGAHGQVRTFTPLVGQDQDRLMNVQASDLEVDKDWTETPANVAEVYVKIYRQAPGGQIEDFTNDIATRTDILDIYGFVDDPDRLQVLDGGVLVLGLTPETGSVLIHNVLITPATDNANLNTNKYDYWVEEVGYKDSDGNVYLNSADSVETGTFFPEYSSSNGEGDWTDIWTSDPAANKIKLNTKGKNKLKIRNHATKDIDVAKKWIDENGEEMEGPWNQPGTETPVATAISFKVKRSDDRYLTFDGSETLTLASDGQRAVVRCSEMDSTAYTVRYVSDADDEADIGDWKTRVHGLQKYAMDGTEYTYTIEELRNEDGKVLNSDNEPIPSCRSTAETAEDGTYVIVNQKVVTSLSIEKIFAGDKSEELTEEQKQKITFHVVSDAKKDGVPVFDKTFRYGVNGEVTETGDMANEDLYVWKDGVLLIKDIQPGIYYVTESGDEVDEIFSDVDPIPTYTHTRTYSVGAAETTEEAVVTVVEEELAEVKVTNTYDDKPAEYDVVILKVDKEDEDLLLPGAVFTLTQIDETKAPNNGVPVYKKDEETGENITVDPTPAMTGADGKVTFEKLTEGYYEIKETHTPAGYVLSGNAAFYIHVKKDRVVLIRKGTDEPSKWAEVETDGNVLRFEAEDETYQATVGNESGSPLPMTGGSGTGIIYLTGILMIGLCSVLLLRRRRSV